MPRIVANGLEFEYAIDGDRDNPVVFAATGFTDQMIDWPASLIDRIVEAGFCFVRYDTRDMGLSTYFDDAGAPTFDDYFAAMAGEPLFDPPYTLQDMADDAVALIEALDLGLVHGVGYSMGGQVLQLAMLTAPERFATGVLIFSTSGSDQLPQFSDATLGVTIDATFRVDDREGGIATLSALLEYTNGSVHPKTAEEIAHEAAASYDRAYHPEGAARHMAAMFATDDYEDELRNVAAPMLVLQGTDDALFRSPAYGEDLAARLPNATLIDIEGAGHNLASSLGPVLADHIITHVAGHRADAADSAPATTER